MKKLALVSLLVFTTAILAGCAGTTTGDTPTEPGAQSTSLTAAALVEALRGAGLALQDAGTVEQPFFSVPAHVFVVEGRDLQIYEFATAGEAEAAAREVAPTGSPIGTTMVTWMAAPHFFRKDRLIVNYIGTSEKALTELQHLLGPQFAGR